MDLDDHRVRPALRDSPLTLRQIQQGIAHHEAAHAVVAAVYGVQCTRITRITRIRVMRVQREDGIGWTEAASYSGEAISAYGLAVVAAGGEHGEVRHLEETGRLTLATRAAARADHDRDTAHPGRRGPRLHHHRGRSRPGRPRGRGHLERGLGGRPRPGRGVLARHQRRGRCPHGQPASP
ncbi:hypothetical protein [Streptomyces sp. BBFR115]|uniref:hypothetical protein n=1 Tax=Streptomyces sp. BBFR115 TaxID=3448173 RepID=UPI003F75798B